MRKLMQNIADYVRETDKLLLFLCTAASVFGCALVYSATRYTGSTRQVAVQLASLFIGLLAAIVVSLFDYRSITRLPLVFVAITVGLLAVTYFFGYAPEGTENKAWIELPMGMSLQVSELIKIIMILTFSKHVCSIAPSDINTPQNLLLLTAHAFAYPAAVMVLQKDLGTVSVMVFIAAVMLFAAGVKARYFALGGAVFAAAMPLIWIYGLSSYQKERFTILSNLESDALGLGYQQLAGLNALGSGGLLGNGYLQGPKTQNYGVPKSYNDFIFTVAGEELGLVGCLAVILILLAIIIRIIRVGVISRDRQGMIICVGAFGIFAAQMLINIGMCLALLPVIGVTLPFFSAGGSSLVCLFLSVGLVLSVYKNRNKRQMYLRDKG